MYTLDSLKIDGLNPKKKKLREKSQTKINSTDVHMAHIYNDFYHHKSIDN